jgi:multidrug resistance efflux pump
MTRLEITMSLLAVAFVAACASNAPAQPASLDRVFAEIQVHEAAIEHARAEISQPTASCEQRREAVARTSGDAARVCELARAAADADALARCERASRTRDDIAGSNTGGGCRMSAP